MIRPFLIPWQMIEREEVRHNLVVELEREMGTLHPLRGLAVHAIARRQDCDDVLFSLADGRVAVVHLTWTGQPDDSLWPECVFYPSPEEFEACRMKPDHAEWMKGLRMTQVKFDAVSPIVGARDLEASIRFYVERLGFTLVFRDGGTPTNYVGLRRGGVELHMQFQHEHEMSILRLRIRVDDPDVLHDEYRSKNVAIASPLENKAWGTREFGIYDPDHNALTFYKVL